METVRNKTERKAEIEMGRLHKKWPEKNGSEELETEGARKETMEGYNWASQNSQRVVELKKKKKKKQIIYVMSSVFDCLWLI